MSAKTNTENYINSLLPFCYEQLINRSNISDALQSITKCIVENTDAVFSCVILNKANEKRTYQYINKNNTTLNESIITQITDEIVNVDIEPNILYTEANFSAIKNIIHATEINTILIFPISKNELKEFIIIAFKHKINTEQYHTLLQKLAVAIFNSSTTENIRNELYLRSDVYESTLATLNQLIWDFDFRTNVIHVLGFAPRIGNFIPQQTITTDFKDWLQKDTHPDDLVRAINHFQNSIYLPNKSTTEIIFRVLEATKKEYIWVHVKHTLLCDDEGKPAIMVGSISDIHDSKQVAFELEKHKEKNEELIQMLRENNEKFIAILNSSKDIIFTIDLQTGQIENVNKAIKKLGYSPKEWAGQYYTQWTLEKRKKFHDMLKHASESNTSVRSRQVSFATKDNKKLIPFEFSTSVFYFKGKKYLLCILRDITERLEHENNIKKVTEQLTHLINNINDVYAIYNFKEKKYEFVSDNIENLLGCSKADFIAHGLYWEELVYTDDYVSAKNQMNAIINNKGRGEFFYRIVTPVGETKMLLEKVTTSINKEGNVDRIYIVKADYTHIENAEQNLIESERKFRFISENITDLITIIDIDGRFMYVSPSSEKVIGYTTEDLVGKNSIFLIHKEDVTPYIEEALEKSVFDKKEVILRYRILSKQGNYYWVETHFKPIIDVNNQTTSIICSTRDVTEREQLMKDLQQALEKEREWNELRSQFVSMASHQFRTPLTVIQSGVELMEMYLEDLPEQNQKPFKKQFKKIASEVTRLQDLMSDVLLLGRADAQRTPFKPQKGSLVQFCKDLITSRYNNQKPKERQVILYVLGNEQEVIFDFKLLDHALENILNNAYKYSEKGEIKMTIQFEHHQVTIAITDEGIGIPENDLANLFQPFYRASNANEFEGTGLGLSIVKEFIEKQGGQLFVESKLNKGTTVKIILSLNPINLN